MGARDRSGWPTHRVVGSVVLGLTLLTAPRVEATIDLQLLTSGVSQPVAIAHAGDGSGRLFIVEQAGRIVIHDGTQLLPTPFLDIRSFVLDGGERGLLGLAFHPQYVSNGQFYVFYTEHTPVGGVVVARYVVSADPDVADPSSRQVILTVDQPAANHNGGQLAFGTDGFLYISLGDGGAAASNAQDLGTLLGSILRIDVDSASSPYGIPPSNPFVGTLGAREEIWVYGLRNSWRFSFDRSTDDLLIGDVGSGGPEEISFQGAASAGGENYGWPVMQGTQCNSPSSGCNQAGLTLPILEYSHGADNCAVTGGYRYRGSQNQSEAGTYLYGDFCSGRIWGGTQSGGGWSSTELLDTTLSISAFGEDESGELYVADIGGAVYRIVDGTPVPPMHTLTVTKTGTGGGLVTTTPVGVDCGGSCSASFAAGTVVTLTAVPDAGAHFAGFVGSADCADGSISLSADVTCTARFELGAAAMTPPPDPGGPGIVAHLTRPLDLDGDGRGDAIRYDAAAGGAVSLIENGSFARTVDGSALHGWSAGWTIRTGDFNADGRTDLFFYDAATGDWFKGVSTTPPGGPAGFSFFGGSWSPGWSVGVLELDGDGRADVFLYEPTTGVWFRCTSTGDGTGDFAYVQGAWSPGWQIHPIALNADGLTDLFLYDVATGSWFRAVNDGVSGFAFTAGAWSPGWQVNPGDYDGDGRDDLFLYDVASGAWYVALNAGTGWTFIPGTFSPGWTVRPGDFDGDGRTDLFLYDVTTGAWFESISDGAGGWTHVGSAWSPGWEIHVTGFDFDSRADVLLYDPATGNYFQGVNEGPASFSYSGGNLGAGQTLVTRRP